MTRATDDRFHVARRAILCPGQGSQHVGMGRDRFDADPAARETFTSADEALGFALSERCFEGPADALTATAVAQPALLTHTVAVWRALEASGEPLEAAVAAGHSLGEWTALVLAGAMRFEDAVRLVHLRGQLMQSAAAPGVGAMAAVLGLDPGAVATACEASSAPGAVVVPATFNSPSHVVISGHAAAVAKASELALERGAMKVLPVAVSAPFHSPLMAPAQAPLAEALAAVDVQPPRFPVRSATRDGWLTEPDAIRETLVAQLTAPVRWTACLDALVADGVDTFCVVGASRHLARMVKRLRLPVTVETRS